MYKSCTYLCFSVILWLKSRVNHKKTHVQLLRKVPTNSRHPQASFGKFGQFTRRCSPCRCRPTLLGPRGHSSESDGRGVWNRQRRLPVPQAFLMRGRDAQPHITETEQRPMQVDGGAMRGNPQEDLPGKSTVERTASSSTRSPSRWASPPAPIAMTWDAATLTAHRHTATAPRDPFALQPKECQTLPDRTPEDAQAHRDQLLPTLRPVPPHPKLRQERGRIVHQNHR